MSTAGGRELGSADALRRYATLVAGALGADAAAIPAPAATDQVDRQPAGDEAREPASPAGAETDGSLIATMWLAAHELRPAPRSADRPGPAAPLPYRVAAAPAPGPEERFDRRG